MTCEHCHSLLPEDAVTCPACGQAVPAQEEGFSGLWSDSPKVKEPTSIGVKVWDEVPSLEAGAKPPPVLPGEAGIETRPNMLPEVMSGGGMHAGTSGTGPTGPMPPAQAQGEVGTPTPGKADQRSVHTRIVPLAGIDGETKLVDVTLSPAARRAMRDKQRSEQAQHDGAADTLLEELDVNTRHLFSRMHRFDRWLMVVLGVAFVGVFLPWHRLAGQGLVAGVEGFGGASALAAVLVAGLVYWRTIRRRLALGLIFLQLISVAGIAAAPLYLLINKLELVPSFGIYTTLGAGAVALILTLLRAARLST